MLKFVPGSHLWDHSRKVQDLEAVAAEMKVGEAFIFLGSTVHGGGANNTGQSRPTHGFFFCRSYIRPEVCGSLSRVCLFAGKYGSLMKIHVGKSTPMVHSR